MTTAGAVRPELKYTPLSAWERNPGKPHRLVADVSIDSRDCVHVYSRDNQAVYVYDREGNLVRSWGEGRFPGRAHGVTVGPDDSVYCINDFDHTVRKFTPEGELLLTLGTSGKPADTGYDMKKRTQLEKNATIARSGPPFHRPTKLAVAANGDLYVADGYGNARIHRFSADGTLIHSWGNPGSGPGEFWVPHGIGIAPDGRVLVADRDNNRIQVFTAEGEYLDQWTGFSHPTSLFIRHGRVYVSEIGWEFDSSASSGDENAVPLCLSVHDLEGHLIARWKSGDEGPLGTFSAPHGLCVDSRGDLYVASNNRRGRGLSVQKFVLNA